MHPSRFHTYPVANCPARPGLVTLLDPLLQRSQPTGTILVGVLLRRGRLHRVVRAFGQPDDLVTGGRVPACWRTVGLLVDVTTRRSEDHLPRPRRLIHLVDRHGAAFTRLAVEGNPPRRATGGEGPVDELCRLLLGLSRPTSPPGTARP